MRHHPGKQRPDPPGHQLPGAVGEAVGTGVVVPVTGVVGVTVVVGVIVGLTGLVGVTVGVAVMVGAIVGVTVGVVVPADSMSTS